MDCSNAEELIERLAEAQGTFEHAGSSTRQDERVNDGANYAGLMSSASYKEKRKEMTVKEDVQANRDAKIAAARAQITADRDAKDAAAQEREAREVVRKEKIKQELAASTGDAEGIRRSAPPAESMARHTKKKLKKASAAAGALSFDADGEDG